MTVRVVVNGPPVPIGTRVGRAIAATLGALLLVVAVLGITGVILIAPFLVLGDAGWSDEERPEAITVAAGCLIAAVACLPLALRLLRGRRRLVLFLRRFGFDERDADRELRRGQRDRPLVAPCHARRRPDRGGRRVQRGRVGCSAGL